MCFPLQTIAIQPTFAYVVFGTLDETISLGWELVFGVTKGKSLIL